MTRILTLREINERLETVVEDCRHCRKCSLCKDNALESVKLNLEYRLLKGDLGDTTLEQINYMSSRINTAVRITNVDKRNTYLKENLLNIKTKKRKPRGVFKDILLNNFL